MNDIEGYVNVIEACVQFNVASGSSLFAAVVVVDAQGCRALLGGCDFRFDHQMSHLRADVVLTQMKVGNLGVVPGLKSHGAPYSAEHEARSPIPSILVGGFAQIRLLRCLSLVAPEVSGSDLPRLRD